jgi:proteasome lid subunit RPN8/RPN11
LFFDISAVYRHAEKCYPRECCGFVFSDGRIYEAENIQDHLRSKDSAVYSRGSEDGYTLSVSDTVELNKSFKSNNPAVIIYHSHPDVGAYFSQEDHDKALYDGRPIYPVAYLVVDVRSGEAQGAKLFEWNGNYFCETLDFKRRDVL